MAAGVSWTVPLAGSTLEEEDYIYCANKYVKYMYEWNFRLIIFKLVLVIAT